MENKGDVTLILDSGILAYDGFLDALLDNGYTITMEKVGACLYLKYETGEPQTGEAMSPKEFAEKMQTIGEVRDPEERHSKMDDLMCDLLRSSGYGEGVEIFKDVEKWYS